MAGQVALHAAGRLPANTGHSGWEAERLLKSSQQPLAAEDVLDLYEQSYDEKRPVVCFDESPEQLIEGVRRPLPPRPGRPARYDVECKCHGAIPNMV